MPAEHGAPLADLLNTAIQHHVRSNLPVAQSLYRAILVADPAFPDALNLLGVTAYQQGRNNRAAGLIGAAIALNSTEATYHSNLALALKRLHRADEAARACRRAVELRPDYAEAHSNMAYALGAIGDLVGALRHAKIAVCLHPAFPEAQSNLEIALSALGHHAAALSTNGHTIRLQPSNAESYSNRSSYMANIGQSEKALMSCKAALCLQPDFPDALTNVGALATRLGFPSRAIMVSRAAVRLAPSIAKPHFNYGNLLRAVRQLDAAATKYHTALCLDPSMAEAYSALGILHSETNATGNAVTALTRAVRLRPGYADALSNLASAHLKLGRVQEALEIYRASLRSRADMAEVHANYAHALQIQGQLPKAFHAIRIALCIEPDLVQGHSNLGDILNEMALFSAGSTACGRAILLNREFPGAYVDSANALRGLGRDGDAFRSYDLAIVLAGGGLEAAYVSKSVLLMERGDFEAAKVSADRALRINPRSAKAWYALSQIVRFKPGDPYLSSLGVLAQDFDTIRASTPDLVYFRFAIAKALTDSGDVEEAFFNLNEGNRLKRSTFAYDPDATDRHMQAIESVFDAGLMARPPRGGNPSRKPIFIVGMPRSGTTLVEQILSSHSLIFGGGEREAFPRIAERLSRRQEISYPGSMPFLSENDLAEIAEQYLADIHAAAPDAMRVTDKMPMNFLYTGLIHLVFPDAKIIHLRRDPVDTCLSIYSKNFTQSQPFAYDLRELGRYYTAYDRLMRHWHEVIPGASLTEIRYEALVRDFENQVKGLLEFCELDWEPACLEFHTNRRSIKTASLAQVRQPIYTSSIGRRRPPDSLLQPLLDELQKG